MANAEYYFEKDKSYIISFDTPNTGVRVYLQGQGKNVNYTHEKYSSALCDGKRHSFKVTAIETKVTKVTWGLILRETTTNNTDSGLLSNLMIEEVENSSTTSTDYEEHQEDNYILPIQQEMLNGDYFELEEDGWKEVHGWTKVVLDGTNNKVTADTTMTSGKYRYKFNSSSVDLKKCSLSSTDEKAYCEQLKLLQDGDTYDCIEGFTVNNNFIYMYVDEFSNGNMTNNFNTELQDNNMIFHIPVVESAYTKLACTEKQSAVLDKLNNLDLFKNTNNIITAENIAKLKLKYVVDTKTYIDNQIADMQNQLNTINELLSTTATSSILLDNLQTDLESEVM